jgi:hypothetical protein
VRVPTIAPLGLEVLFSNWGKLGHYVEELAKLGYRMNLVEAQIYGSCNSFESFRRGLIFHCSKNAWEERSWLHLVSEPEKRTQYFPGNKKRTFVLRARPRKLQPARSCPNDWNNLFCECFPSACGKNRFGGVRRLFPTINYADLGQIQIRLSPRLQFDIELKN